MCSYVGSSIFYNCYALSSVSLPMCTFISSDAFYGCSNLQFVNLANLSSLALAFFSGKTNLQEVILDKCEYIGGYAFSSCNLNSINLPVCSYID